MTDIQLKYWTLEETKRHDLRTEGQTDVDLNRRQREYEEVVRHNKSTENISHWYNQANISLGYSSLDESRRHNKVTEDVAYINAASQRMSAQASQTSAQASLKSASAAQMNAATNRMIAPSTISLNTVNAEKAGYEAESAKVKASVNESTEFSQTVSGWLSPITDVIGAATKIFR